MTWRGSDMVPGLYSLVLAAGAPMDSDGFAVWDPPARYDGAYQGQTRWRKMPQSRVPQACEQLFSENSLDIGVAPTQLGCAAVDRDGTCQVVTIDKPAPARVGGRRLPARPEDVFRHEVGHCNGWHSSHPE